MIVVVSIVDKHKPSSKCHVGTYLFEVDYPNNTHFDFMTLAVPPENEHLLRPYLGRLLGKEDMPDPVRGDGSPL